MRSPARRAFVVRRCARATKMARLRARARQNRLLRVSWEVALDSLARNWIRSKRAAAMRRFSAAPTAGQPDRFLPCKTSCTASSSASAAIPPAPTLQQRCGRAHPAAYSRAFGPAAPPAPFFGAGAHASCLSHSAACRCECAGQRRQRQAICKYWLEKMQARGTRFINIGPCAMT